MYTCTCTIQTGKVIEILMRITADRRGGEQEEGRRGRGWEEREEEVGEKEEGK